MNNKYIHIKIKLIGKNGNAFSILAKVNKKLEKHNVPQQDRDLFLKQAMSGDYNNLLRVCMNWFTIV